MFAYRRVGSLLESSALRWEHRRTHRSKGVPPMESSDPTRVLIVAHKTAATDALMQAVHERAERGPCVFTLLVPKIAHGMHKAVDADDVDADEAQQVIDDALPALRDAAGAPV